ncbi:FAD-binding protein [Streptomyces sp. DSM 41534]
MQGAGDDEGTSAAPPSCAGPAAVPPARHRGTVRSPSGSCRRSSTSTDTRQPSGPRRSSWSPGPAAVQDPSQHQRLTARHSAGSAPTSPEGSPFRSSTDGSSIGRRPGRPRDYQRALVDGLIAEASTIQELAERIGVDPDPLEASIRRYNEQVRAGANLDFGRPTGAEGVGHGPIDTPPFYGFRCAAGLTATYCGVAVDDRLRVIDVFGDVIPGLCAAGEVVGGFHGAGYLTGSALGKAAVFGHLAGTTAASRPPIASTTGSRTGTTAGQQRPTAPRRRWPAGGTEPSA